MKFLVVFFWTEPAPRNKYHIVGIRILGPFVLSLLYDVIYSNNALYCVCVYVEFFFFTIGYI